MNYEHNRAYVYDATSQTFDEMTKGPPRSLFADIAEFHEKFELAYSGPPRVLDEELAKFRVGFLAEELGEYCLDHHDTEELVHQIKQNMAPQNVPLDKQFDALIDLVYVALGTAYLQGFDFHEGWRRVHEANMKKVRVLRAVDSARGSTYDVAKPEGWVPPSLTDLV